MCVFCVFVCCLCVFVWCVCVCVSEGGADDEGTSQRRSAALSRPSLFPPPPQHTHTQTHAAAAPRPAHRGVVDAVDRAVRARRVEAVRLALDVRVALEEVEGVLEDGDVDVGQQHRPADGQELF